MAIKVRMSFVMSMELFVKEARCLPCVNSKLRKASFTLLSVQRELYYKFSVALCFCELQWNHQSLSYNLFMNGQRASTVLSALYICTFLFHVKILPKVKGHSHGGIATSQGNCVKVRLMQCILTNVAVILTHWMGAEPFLFIKMTVK